MAKRRRRSVRNYFNFHWMITPDIIKAVHILGIIGLNLLMIGGTIGGIAALIYFQNDLNMEAGLLVLACVGAFLIGLLIGILVNLWWRVILEQAILFFSIHEVLSSIEYKQDEMKEIMEKEEEEKEE